MENNILPVNKQMIEITKQLIERCYKYESQFFETDADRNICEAELRDIDDTVDSIMSDLDLTEREEYEEELEALEDTIKEQKEEYDALMVKYEDLEEDYKDLEKTLDKVKEAIWS